jgi:hypothetical protein
MESVMSTKITKHTLQYTKLSDGNFCINLCPDDVQYVLWSGGGINEEVILLIEGEKDINRLVKSIDDGFLNIAGLNNTNDAHLEAYTVLPLEQWLANR